MIGGTGSGLKLFTPPAGACPANKYAKLRDKLAESLLVSIDLMAEFIRILPLLFESNVVNKVTKLTGS